MSYFDASRAITGVSMIDSMQLSYRAKIGGTGHAFTWEAQRGITITAFSALGDIAAAGSAPTAGTIDAIAAADALGNPLYRIAGVTMSLPAITVKHPHGQATQTFWRAALDGDTVIRAPDNARFTGYGDSSGYWTGENEKAVQGGNDLFIGGRSLKAFQEFAGDVWSPQYGTTLTGGDDVIRAFGPGAFYGDTYSAGGSSGPTVGGNDTISLVGRAGGAQIVLVGDVGFIGSGQLTGGDDTIVMRDTQRTGAIAGDALEAASVLTAASVMGGNDRISLVDGHTDGIYGDVRTVGPFGRGGNDVITLVGSASGETSGDFGEVRRPQGLETQVVASGGRDVIKVVQALHDFMVAGDAIAALGGGSRLGGFNGGIDGGDDMIDARLAGQHASLYGDAVSAAGWVTGGNDIMFGGRLGDLIVGDVGTVGRVAMFVAGNDTLYGGDGKDTIYGDAKLIDASAKIGTTGGNDRIDGGTGDDRLFGQVGDDRLIGGLGNDTLAGGAGNDRMEGGAGADLFVFAAAAEGTDTIRDFDVTADLFDLSGALFTRVAEAGDTTVLTYEGGRIMVTGVSGLTLDAWNGLVVSRADPVHASAAALDFILPA
ncbi:MAG: hypothetical protein IT548_07185 [Alphaproteobacteria bacterium]|nr:hypothetical protein [Alphaproteobacteria bacterium]